MMLTPSQLQILQHSLGCDEYGRGTQYRNGFVADELHRDHPDLEVLRAAGLMSRAGPVDWMGGAFAYSVTDAGKREMRNQSPVPPKVSRAQRRWQQYVNSGACECGIKFGDWLKRRTYIDATPFWPKLGINPSSVRTPSALPTPAGQDLVTAGVEQDRKPA